MEFLTAILADIASKLQQIPYVFLNTGKEPREPMPVTECGAHLKSSLRLFVDQKFVIIHN